MIVAGRLASGGRIYADGARADFGYAVGGGANSDCVETYARLPIGPGGGWGWYWRQAKCVGTRRLAIVSACAMAGCERAIDRLALESL